MARKGLEKRRTREEWKGSLTGDQSETSLPPDGFDRPHGYNINNPNPDRVYYWRKDRGLSYRRER